MSSRQTRPNQSRRRKANLKDSPAMLPTRPRTLYVARVSTRRNALALAFASLAIGALLAVRPLANSSGRFGETLGFETFLAMLALAFATRSPRGIRERLGLGPSKLPLGALALLALGTLALSYSLDGIYRLIEPPDSGALFQFESELAGARGGTLAFALLSFALVPGFAEEILCRGLVQRGLQQRCGPIAAILLASLFFGALHMDPIHSAFAAILGLYLGTIAYLAGSVRASVGCHVANNTAAVLGAAVTPGIGPMPTPSLVIAAAFSLGVLGWLWRRHRPTTAARTPKKEGSQGLQKRRGLDDP
jgi:membrane protease YdiL (CAAX protease family)